MTVFLGLVLSVLALALVLPVLRFLLFARRVRQLTRNVPGPKTYPVVGNFLDFAVLCQKDLYLMAKRLMEEFPTGFIIWMGPLAVIFVFDPDDLEVIFTSPHMSSKYELAYDTLGHIIGRGLINMNGPNYRRHRKAITNSLHLDILQDFVHTFAENGRKLVSERLEALADSGVVFDCTPLLGWCATHAVCETVLSTDTVDMEEEWDAFVSVSHRASSLMLLRALQPWFWNERLFRLSKHYKEYRQVSSGMTSFVSKILNRKIAQIKSGNVPKRRRQAFLDHVLRSDEGEVLSKDELFNELKTLLFAASSTSMDFMSLFLVCMSIFPDIQKEVQRELDEIFGDEWDRAEQPEDLPHMQYLERVLKEVLRVFPPVSLFGRVATEDVTLPSGIVLPKGVPVGIVPFITHRNEKFFPEPGKFDPDRFLPENTRGRHPFSYVPFSAGGRNCIGQRYGLMFAKTVGSCILRRFTVLPAPDGPKTLDEVHLMPGISLTILGGARVRLERRERPPTAASRAPACSIHRDKHYSFVASVTAIPAQIGKSIA